jgi:hypothetical protein
MSSELEARLTRQGLIWDNLYGSPASRRMVSDVRSMVDGGAELADAIAWVEGEADDGGGEAEFFIVPRHG